MAGPLRATPQLHAGALASGHGVLSVEVGPAEDLGQQVGVETSLAHRDQKNPSVNAEDKTKSDRQNGDGGEPPTKRDLHDQAGGAREQARQQQWFSDTPKVCPSDPRALLGPSGDGDDQK